MSCGSCGKKSRYDIERETYQNSNNRAYYESKISEGYNYIHNQPKNVNAIILNRNQTENYGYDYALYKGINNTPPTEAEKKEFEGVL